jgi:hypothetical protein
MRRAFRILVYGATMISLLLCVASGVLWVRSYREIDRILWEPAAKICRSYVCDSGHGVLRLQWSTEQRPAETTRFGHLALPAVRGYGQFFRGWVDKHTWNGFAWRSTYVRDPNGVFDSSSFELVLPQGFILLCLALLPGIVLYRTLRNIRKRSGRCVTCGYDLRATPDRCPECGTVPSVPAARLAGPSGFGSRRRRDASFAQSLAVKLP